MEIEAAKQEIDALIAEIGDELTVAKPAAERAVTAKIRFLLEQTRDLRTGAARAIWETYLPYAANLCYRLSRLDEGWEEDLEYFASENAQFWLDNANAFLDEGDYSGASRALGHILEAARMIKQDMITRVDILLQALDIALEISDKKRSLQLYEEAERTYRKHLAGSDQYLGTAWLRKIKKFGQQLDHYQQKLRRYYRYAESIIVTVEADTGEELEKVIDYLLQNLAGKIKVTRGVKAVDGQGKPGAGKFRARLKITLDPAE